MNILYLMHIDWKWIKQRPQFLAEELGKTNNVFVFSTFATKKRKQLQNNKTELFHKYLFRIPFSGKLHFLKAISNSINKIRLSRFIKKHHIDYVWLTEPNLVGNVPKKYLSSIIYDCMDDYLSFGLGNIETIKANEKIVCDNAKFVLASSESLKNKIIERYGAKDVQIVRNAFPGVLQKCVEQPCKEQDKFVIAYFGTISRWFDFDLIKEVTNTFKDVCFKLYGPTEINTQEIANSNIIFCGTVSHSELYNSIKDVDCLIMPFMLNELILSVDPVKLYEYVNFEKNIICVEYPEVERFRDFVYFYNNSKECVDVVRKLRNDNTLKYNKELKSTFLQQNTWSSRAEQINTLIRR